MPIEITSERDLPSPALLKSNKIIGNFKMINSKIRVFGEGNIIYLSNVIVNNSTINIRNNHSILFAVDTRISNFQPLIINEDSNVVILSGLTSGRLAANIGDGNLIIGRDCMFADDIFIQSHDGHSIYDAKSHKLVNEGKSICIGDHVWLGRRVNVIKGSFIGSGSLVGAGALVCNKLFNCNSAIGGIPARELKSDIFWTRKGAHVLSKEEKKQIGFYNSDEYIFSNFEYQGKFIELDRFLNITTDPNKRLDKLVSQYLI